MITEILQELKRLPKNFYILTVGISGELFGNKTRFKLLFEFGYQKPNSGKQVKKNSESILQK